MKKNLQAVFDIADALECNGARLPFPGAARRRVLETAERTSSSLIEAVTQSEHARSRKADAEEQLSLWNALVDGRWSIVESLERDGRRMLLASRNEPRVAALRRLNAREEAVVEQVAFGRSYKYIAAELGVSISAVLLALRSALRKLGLKTRVELIRTFGG